MKESYLFDFCELLVLNAVQHVSLGNVRLDSIPVTQRKDVQKKLPLISQKTSMSLQGCRHRCFLQHLTALSYPSLKTIMQVRIDRFKKCYWNIKVVWDKRITVRWYLWILSSSLSVELEDTRCALWITNLNINDSHVDNYQHMIVFQNALYTYLCSPTY